MNFFKSRNTVKDVPWRLHQWLSLFNCVVMPGGGILGLSPKDEGCEM